MVVNIDSLKRDELEELLFKNVCYGSESGEVRQRIKTLYSLLSDDELRVKAHAFFDGQLVRETVIKTDRREINRREIIMARNKKEAQRREVKTVHTTILPTYVKTCKTEEMCNELMIKSWVRDASEICEDNILCIIEDDITHEKALKRCMKIGQRIGYLGVVKVAYKDAIQYVNWSE